MSDGSALLSVLLLLVATVAVPLAIRLRQRPSGTPDTWRCAGSRARDSQNSQVAPAGPSSPPAQVTPAQHPGAPGSSLYIPCGCSPDCSPCTTASQELQDVVMPERSGEPFPQDSWVCQTLWEDLEKLVERGHLSCCGSSSSSGSPPPARSRRPSRASIRRKASMRASAHPRTRRRRRASAPGRGSIPSRSLSDSCQSPGRGAPTDSPPRPGAAGIGTTCPGLTMQMARKNLEVKLGAQPAAVRRSQEQVAQQDVSSRHRCPAHGSQGAAAVPYEKSVRAVLDKILQREGNMFPSPGPSLELEKEYAHTSSTPGKSLHPSQSLCVTPYGGAPLDRPPCSLRATGTNRTHLAWKSLGTEVGGRAIPAEHSQQQGAQQDVSRGRQCPIHGSRGAAVPYERTLRAVLDEILRRERRAERPRLQGALWGCLARVGMEFVAAAQALQRFLCAK